MPSTASAAFHTASFLIPSSCYELVSVRDASEPDEWQTVNKRSPAWIISASDFGMVLVSFKCICCDHTTIERYFFHTDLDDMTFRQFMRPRFDGNSVYISLPGRIRGRFDLFNGPNPLLDGQSASATVLRHAAIAIEEEQENCTLQLFLNKLHFFVQRKAIFHRLKKHARRSKTVEERLLAIHVLNQNFVHEQGLQLKVLRLAKLW